jgi:hypothetical protein
MMSYGGYLVRHPLFWALLAGAGLGVAVAAATWRSSRSRRPRRAQSRKWTTVWLALTVAVAAATLGMIVPPELVLLEASSLAAAAAGLLVAGLGVRFPRASGVPLLLVIAVVSVLGALLVRDLHPVRSRTELAQITVLSIREDELALEVTREVSESTGVPRIVTVPRDGLSFSVHTLELSPALFLLGAPRFVRYVGPGGGETPEESAVLLRAKSAGLARTVVLAPALPRFNILRTYSLTIRPEDRPTLARSEENPAFVFTSSGARDDI